MVIIGNGNNREINMNVLIYSDVHFSQDSSIVRSMGAKYSTRLEYLIKSLNWAEELAEKEHCFYIFNLGDTFDKPNLNAQELTALKEVKWTNRPHYILVGNHDSNVNSLKYSTSEIFKSLNVFGNDKFHVISEPTMFCSNGTCSQFLLFPYVTEDNRKNLKEYCKWNDYENKVVLSHNDIKGVQLGKFISQDGFDIKDIEDNCDLFLNGHLHNSSYITNKILNIGNLCGMNFSEDGFKYSHGCWILDTETLKLTFYENPYALNFYKIEINDEHPFLHEYIEKPNNVFMIRCERKHLDNLRISLTNNYNVVAYKIIGYDENVADNMVNNIKIEKVDYLKTFSDFIIDKLGNSDIIINELEEICK